MAVIVIMEDDDIIRGLLTRLVQSRGDEAHAFEDGQPALDAMDFGAVDLVITDLRMPLRGDEVVDRLRAQNIQTPVLFLTGELLNDTHHAELIGLGNCQIMSKPFRIKELLATVDEILG